MNDVADDSSDLQLIIQAVDDTSHAASILEDLQTALWDLEEQLREREMPHERAILSVNLTALSKAKRLLESGHEASNTAYTRMKEREGD